MHINPKTSEQAKHPATKKDDKCSKPSDVAVS